MMTAMSADVRWPDVTPACAWLAERIPGFAELKLAERDGISDFTLLWSLFEARVLANRGSIDVICGLASQWLAQGRLDVEAFGEELTYLRGRYWDGSGATGHFDHLRISKARHASLVLSVLAGSDEEPDHRMTALLIVIFRYRNNLFHGEKWQYGLRDQRDNFDMANRALMKLLDRYGGMGA